MQFAGHTGHPSGLGCPSYGIYVYPVPPPAPSGTPQGALLRLVHLHEQITEAIPRAGRTAPGRYGMLFLQHLHGPRPFAAGAAHRRFDVPRTPAIPRPPRPGSPLVSAQYASPLSFNSTESLRTASASRRAAGRFSRVRGTQGRRPMRKSPLPAAPLLDLQAGFRLPVQCCCSNAQRRPNRGCCVVDLERERRFHAARCGGGFSLIFWGLRIPPQFAGKHRSDNPTHEILRPGSPCSRAAATAAIFDEIESSQSPSRMKNVRRHVQCVGETRSNLRVGPCRRHALRRESTGLS